MLVTTSGSAEFGMRMRSSERDLPRLRPFRTPRSNSALAKLQHPQPVPFDVVAERRRSSGASSQAGKRSGHDRRKERKIVAEIVDIGLCGRRRPMSSGRAERARRRPAQSLIPTLRPAWPRALPSGWRSLRRSWRAFRAARPGSTMGRRGVLRAVTASMVRGNSSEPRRNGKGEDEDNDEGEARMTNR